MSLRKNSSSSQVRLVCRHWRAGLCRFAWIVIVLVFLIPGYSSAELYMYKDKEGNVHFTNNRAEIPADFQSGAKRLPDKKGYQAPPPKTAETEAVEETEKPPPAQESSDAKEEQRDPAVLKDFQARKAALDTERAQLEAKQDELMRKVQTYGMETPVRRDNREIIDVSERLAEQESKRDALVADWEAYVVPPKDSPDYETLKETKASLDSERKQIEEEQAQLLQKGKSVRGSVSHRYYKNKTRDLLERMTAFHNKRDAFEKKWEAFYSSP